MAECLKGQKVFVCSTEVSTQDDNQAWELEVSPEVFEQRENAKQWFYQMIEKANKVGLSIHCDNQIDDDWNEEMMKQQLDNDIATVVRVSDENGGADIRVVWMKIK